MHPVQQKERFNVKNLQERFIGKIICKKYKILRFINKGHFGAIFKAKELTDQEIKSHNYIYADEQQQEHTQTDDQNSNNNQKSSLSNNLGIGNNKQFSNSSIGSNLTNQFFDQQQNIVNNNNKKLKSLQNVLQDQQSNNNFPAKKSSLPSLQQQQAQQLHQKKVQSDLNLNLLQYDNQQQHSNNNNNFNTSSSSQNNNVNLSSKNLQINNSKREEEGRKRSIYEQLLDDSEEEQEDSKKNPNTKYVAVKVENLYHNGQYLMNTLKREISILKKLNGQIGFPKLMAYKINKTEAIMVIDYLNQSLQQLLEQQSVMGNDIENENEFSIQTTLMIGLQAIDRIEALHNIGYIHRDIKPDNLMIGSSIMTQSIIHLIDFGIAKKYIDKDGKHIKYTTGNKFVGTKKYAAIAADKGYEQGRKDDLESLGYSLVYFMKGELPWKCLAYGQDNMDKLKENTDLSDLCNDLHYEFWKYFKYVKSLKFNEKPNYNYLKSLFRGIIQQENLYENFAFDWQDQDSFLKTNFTNQTIFTSKLHNVNDQEEEDNMDSYMKKQQQQQSQLKKSKFNPEQNNNKQNQNLQEYQSIKNIVEIDEKLQLQSETKIKQQQDEQNQELQKINKDSSSIIKKNFGDDDIPEEECQVFSQISQIDNFFQIEKRVTKKSIIESQLSLTNIIKN